MTEHDFQFAPAGITSATSPALQRLPPRLRERALALLAPFASAAAHAELRAASEAAQVQEDERLARGARDAAVAGAAARARPRRRPGGDPEGRLAAAVRKSQRMLVELAARRR